MELGSESGTVAFKTDMRQLDKGLISLTAMVNRSNHGTVYFGVDSTGYVSGLQVDAPLFDKIRYAVRKNILPRLTVDVVEHVSTDGKSYVSVSAAGFETPYSYDGRYYVRNSANDDMATPETISRLVLARRFDAMKETEAYSQDLTFETFGALMVSHGRRPRRDRGYYNTIGLLTKEGDFNLNAYLLADRNSVRLQVTEYYGTTKEAFSKITDYGGKCLFTAMREVYDRVKMRNQRTVNTDQGVRAGTALFDAECLKEAWFNACLHNSWRTGIPPMLSIFDDRFEIESAGTIPFGLPQEDFFGGRSMPVNESLYNLASSLGFNEHVGRGVPLVTDRYGRNTVRIKSGTVTVTIPFAFEPAWVADREWTAEYGMPVSPQEEEVLDYLLFYSDAKLADISENTGLNLSSVKRIIVKLKSKGLLENTGTNRNSIWQVSSSYRRD